MFDKSLLFESGALTFSPAEKPYFFTSGLLCPFYVNTHFICGGQKNAERVLSFLDERAKRPSLIVKELPPLLDSILSKSESYKLVIDEMASIINENYGILNDKKNSSNLIISGGQRRDWLFSVPLAKKLRIKHLYLFNDKSILNEAGNVLTSDNFNDSHKVIHVADLLTVGSSYLTKWIPALRNLDLNIDLSINCVDRLQGGVHNLTSSGVTEVINLAEINDDFFKLGEQLGYLNEEQSKLVSAYRNDPEGSMRAFLLKSPEFLKEALQSDEKTVKRAKLHIELNPYKMPDYYLKEVLS